MDTNIQNKISCNKVEEANHIMNELNSGKNVTEEEFQNFMHRVVEVGRYFTFLVSCKFKFFNKIIRLRKNRKKVSIFRSKGTRMRTKVSRRNFKAKQSKRNL